MKRNRILRTALAVLICCAVTLCLLPATLSRYTSVIPTDNITVRAALFSVVANGTDFTAANVTTIATPVNFGRLLQPDSWDYEENVYPDDGTIIAPGTGGYFRIHFENQSEVPVRFSFLTTSGVIAIGNAPSVVPHLQFATSNAGSWADLATVLGDINPLLDPNMPNHTVQVYWRWPFNPEAHVAHTALGRAAYEALENGEDLPGVEVIIQFRAEQLAA